MAAYPGQPPRLDASGPRVVVFCHQCEHEWYEHQDGLVCPRCEGEIIEIITPESDPRPERPPPAVRPRPRRIYPPAIYPPRSPRPEDNPDPEEADIEEHVTHGEGGSVLFSRTVRSSTTRTPFGTPPRRGGDPHSEDPDFALRNFQNMIGNLMGPQFQPGQVGRSGTNTLFNEGNGVGGQTFRVGGDGNGPAVMGARYTFGGPAPGQQPGNEDFYGAPPPPGPAQIPDGAHALAIIIGALYPPMGPGQHEHPMQIPLGLQDFYAAMLDPVNARSGDAVYTQEALDQIISTLMEQHPTSNAPGPASPDAIAALPKKKLGEKELGPESKGECSVCMDDVTIGVEVVVLPCSHWFHEACASAWLSEHNTCPICRKGIEGETPPPNSRRSSQGTLPTRNEHRARRISSFRPRLDRFAPATARIEARLEAIRNSGMPPTEDRDRYGDRATPQPGSDDHNPPLPSSFRRLSEMSENQRDNRRGNTSISDRSRESRRSSHSGNNTTGGGAFSWLRDRFGSGSGSGSGSNRRGE